MLAGLAALGSKKTWGTIAVLAAFAGVLFAVYLGYSYLTSVIEDNTELQKEVNTLTTEITNVTNKNENLVKRLEVQATAVEQLLKQHSELRELYNKNVAEQNKIKDVLRKHDLEYLASKKPGLIETRVNRAIAKLGTDIEEVTKIDEETE